ncbi:hypothetical protein [Oceanicaulis sp.]|uniref:hypothetical protein n=1 Tax=Oceanicaulis sp. TaxID=1924941 RepID=UPI003F72A13E
MLDRILHPLDGLWRAAVVLYEPALFYAGAAGTAVTATMVQGGGLTDGFDRAWIEAAAYLAGSGADLHFRGRAYAKLPVGQRASRAREWKARLGLAAIGLSGAFFASLVAQAALVHVMPADIARASFPLVNFALVLIAVPVIDGFRGFFRLLSGQSSQEAFVGLVINWARKRSGQDAGGSNGR